jgi:uncharacterized tellurite resistance protein B-like protein
MFEGLKSFFARHAQPDPDKPGVDRLHVAASALLLEMAHADDSFTDDERRHIEEIVRRQFGLSEETAKELIEVAERARKESTGLYTFTSLVNEHYDEGQRMVLAELLWRVVYADGTLSPYESLLAQKLSRLLDLRPGYLAEARRRAVGDEPTPGGQT